MSTVRLRPSRLAALVTIGLALIALGCSSSDESSTATTPASESTTTITPATPTTEAAITSTTRSQTDDPADVATLYDSVGNPNGSAVLVFAQGGPTPGLDSNGFGLLTGGLDLDKVQVLNVHQAQTLDPGAFTSADIDLEAAKAANDESVRILADVVSHFQSDGRRVVVLGISFGGLLVQDLLATQGNVADEYVIVVGRLDFPEAASTIFSDGGAVDFVNGTEVVEIPIETLGYGTGTSEGERNMARLLGGLASENYTELLATVDLSNLTFVYADADEQVGRLTDIEIAFLETAGAKVISNPGGHVDAIFDQTGPALAAALGP